MKKVSVLLADGFEEIEALTVVDLLRRAKVYVDTVSITDEYTVRGSHGIPVLTEDLFDEVDFSESDMIVLPGGLPGTTNLKEHAGVRKVVKGFYDEGKYVAAICAAPTILARLHITDGRKATCYPGMEDQMGTAQMIPCGAVQDGSVITGRAAGSADEFGLACLRALKGEETARQVASGIVYRA